MAKKPQKPLRSSKPTRAERQAARKKDKKPKGAEKEPTPPLTAQVGGGKGAPKVSQELSKRNSGAQRRPKKEKESK